MKHLSSQQISEWLAGVRTAGQEQHVRECPDCAEAVGRMENLLADFGRAYQQRGEGPVWEPAIGTARSHRLGWWPRAAFASAVLAAMIAAVPVVREHRMRAAQIAAEDDALLTAIQTDVARSVPVSLNPLAELTSGSLERSSQ